MAEIHAIISKKYTLYIHKGIFVMIQWNSIPFNTFGGTLFNVPNMPMVMPMQSSIFQFASFNSMSQIPNIPYITPTPQGVSSFSNPFAGGFNFSMPSFYGVPFPTLNVGNLLSNARATASSWYNSARSTVSAVSTKISNFASRIISGAKRYFGYKESDGSYKKFTNGRTEAWCADFATYVARENGSNIPHFSGVSQILDWGRRNNRFSTTAKAGDLIVFKGVDKNGKQVSHTGIVTKVENGKVYTIEGNASNAVNERSYALNDSKITGYVSVA